MNKFHRITHKQFENDFSGTHIQYEDIKLPQRSTKYSAGYDLFANEDMIIEPGQTIKIPTGIKVELDNDKFLMIVPRSSLGFKYRLQLNNTCGIIDSDYFNNQNNEGHIFVKMTNCTNENKTVVIKKGEAFAQGIILNYFTTVDDDSNTERIGGIGSTNK